MKKGVIRSLAAAGTTPSVQSQIIARAVALLGAGGTYKAYRTRMTTFAAKDLPAFNVLPEDGETEFITAGQTDRKFRFNVRCMAQAVDQVDVAADALYCAAVTALLTDPTLGGLVRITREGRQKWDLEKGEVEAVALVVTFETEFSTKRNNPTVSGY